MSKFVLKSLPTAALSAIPEIGLPDSEDHHYR